MNIIYLTTSMRDVDFDFLLERAENKPNPSNQNFHAKLIDSLKVAKVVSLVPVTTKTKFLDSGNYRYVNYGAKWEYLLFPRHKEIYSTALPLLRKEGDNVVLFDSLSVPCAKAACRLKRKKGAKIVAILTDNPSNLSKRDAKYEEDVAEYIKEADAYLSLSEGLLEAFGVKDKPHLVFPGIATELNEAKDGKEAYVYFGGALYERYGVSDFIEAFLEAKLSYHLYIAGHGPLGKAISELNPAKVTFLGQISRKDHESYLGGSSFLINPRRIDGLLDEQSVPSKFFEDLSAQKPILSTRHPALERLFRNEINWIDEGKEGMYAFFMSHRDEEGHLQGLVTPTEGTLSPYLSEAIGSKVLSFLETL